LRLGEAREQQRQSERARFEERESKLAADLLAANQAALEAGRAHEASMRAAKEAARVHEASLLAAQETAAGREASLRAEFALASEQLHCSIAEAEREKVALQSRLIQTLSEYRGLIQERDNAQAEMRQHAHQLSLARAESDSLKLARKELEDQLQCADHRLAEREEALRVSEARTREVLDSSSWRLTAPLRLLVAMMRGSRHGVSKYLGETLRNASRIPGVRGVAARLVPEHGRLRRYLAAHVPPPAPTVLLPASSASMSTVAFGYAGSERSRLVSRMVNASCKEDDVLGLQE
jgi:chromosome segregation ATPase